MNRSVTKDLRGNTVNTLNSRISKMLGFILSICLTNSSNVCMGQGEIKSQQFSVSLLIGPQYNYFVASQNYGAGFPPIPGYQQFFKKNSIGWYAGLDATYRIGEQSRFGLGIGLAENRKEVNYSARYTDVALVDWHISHRTHLLQIMYERDWSKKCRWFAYDVGLFYMRFNLQEIEIGDFPSNNRFFGFEERNYKNSGLEEGGVFLGFHLSKPIDNHVQIGLRSRTYYLLSTQSFEMTTITPTITYYFGKSAIK